jgi:pimeloyl-ACP methyl ester carboxylesterase
VTSQRRRVFAGAPALSALAVLTGCAVAANMLAARRTQERHPPRGRFVLADGVRLHLIDTGAGVAGAPVIVMIHGNGAMAEDFLASGVVDALAPEARIVLIDRPGCGHSDRPGGRLWTPRRQARAIGAALDAIGVERAVVVGHSYGSLVALELGLLRPALVGALVLLSGYYFPSVRGDVPLMAGAAVPVLGDIQRYTVGPLLSWLFAPAFVRLLFAPRKVTAGFTRGFPLAMSVRPSQLRAIGADAAFMVPAAAAMQRGPRPTMPVTIVTGDSDRIVAPPMQSERLHEALAGSRFVSLAGHGHMIHHTATEDVADAIRNAFADAMLADQTAANTTANAARPTVSHAT